mgnify:CR=1 FL=1
MLLSVSLFLLAALVLAVLSEPEGTMADGDILGPYAYAPENNPLTGPPGLPIGAVTSVRFRPDGADVKAEHGSLCITMLADDLIRVLAMPQGMEEPEPSHAVVKTDWPQVVFVTSDDAEILRMKTSAASVTVRKSDGAVTVASADGTTVLDAAAFSWMGSKPRVRWSVPGERRFYGFDLFLDGRIDDVLRTDDIREHRLVHVILAARNLLQRGGVEDQIDVAHRFAHRLRVAHISYDEGDIDLILELPAHVVLLLLVPAEDADFRRMERDELLRDEMPERTGAPGNENALALEDALRHETLHSDRFRHAPFKRSGMPGASMTTTTESYLECRIIHYKSAR